jgi:perosamine synthetase
MPADVNVKTAALAIDGGAPVRSGVLPYGKPWVDEDDKRAVLEVLASDFLTTGPKVGAFEKAFAEKTGAKDAVSFSNGTASLHGLMTALDIGPGDEVIVPAMTFVASANCVAYRGGTPVICDVDPDTLLISAESAASKITPRTKAIVAVDYAGQMPDYAALERLCVERGIAVVADACHSLGAFDARGVQAGRAARMSAFSFHPVKTITTGEGGVVTTDDPALAKKMRTFRNHGIETDFRQREAAASFSYDMVSLGYNYRLSDVHCALGIAQLAKLDAWVARRASIADAYDARLAGLPMRALARRPGKSAWHLYVVQLDLDKLRVDRAQVFRALRAEGIGVNVHYIPVHHHSFYRERFGAKPGDHPHADRAFDRILSLPLFPKMSDADVDDVVTAMHKVLGAYAA